MEWKQPEPARPQILPPDDPAWVAKLKELPANQWVAAKPQPARWGSRDWGNLGCDPVRGLAVYFGGGHSTYQINDVAIYSPGANRWSFAAGDHNSVVPPLGWDGLAVGFRGGANAGHQRNIYEAMDGRMYVNIGSNNKETRYGGIPDGTRPGPRYTWFYDFDRGGLWRRQRIAEATKTGGADGFWGATLLSTPDGRLIGFGEDHSAGAYVPAKPHFCVSIYDANRNTLECRETSKPVSAGISGECSGFCFLADRDQVLMVGRATVVYDIKANVWKDLEAKGQPTEQLLGLAHIIDQKAVWAVTKTSEYLYSLETNTWRRLGDKKIKFGGPYAQVVYCAKYGVLVSVPFQLSVMRLDAKASP